MLYTTIDKINNNLFTKNKKEYSFDEAFFWLCTHAEEQDNIYNVLLFRYGNRTERDYMSQDISVSEGELFVSRRYLATTFGWSEGKLRKWLIRLVVEDKIYINQSGTGGYRGKSIIGIKCMLNAKNIQKHQ